MTIDEQVEREYGAIVAAHGGPEGHAAWMARSAEQFPSDDALREHVRRFLTLKSRRADATKAAENCLRRVELTWDGIVSEGEIDAQTDKAMQAHGIAAERRAIVRRNVLARLRAEGCGNHLRRTLKRARDATPPPTAADIRAEGDERAMLEHKSREQWQRDADRNGTAKKLPESLRTLAAVATLIAEGN